MRIHTYTLTERDVYEAAGAASKFGHGRCFVANLSRHGSRSHDHAFAVNLTGDGTVNKRRVNYGTSQTRDRFDREFAATWDQWGVFLAVLFDRDPDMIAGPYKGVDDFHRQTGNVFMGAVVAE